MLKETITYFDLDDNEVTETHYFHITAAEIIELNAQYGDEGPQAVLERLTQAKKYDEVLKLIKQIVFMTYGRREGQRFVKNEEITNAFIESGAFSAFFIKLFQDPEYTAKFVAGVLPRDLARQSGATSTLLPPPPLTGSTPSV